LAAGGGGAGAIVWGEITGVTGTYNAVIGAGGSGGNTGSGVPSSGTATSFNTTISADGGSIGGSFSSSFTGGACGGPGQSSIGIGGPGGRWIYNNYTLADAPVNSGAGGGGGIAESSGTFYSGNGGSGIIYVWEFA
jgi:hypothetical protein